MSPVPGPARGRCLRGGPGAGRPGLGALQRCKRPRFSTLGAGRWHRARDRWRLPSIPGATAHRRECPPEPGILSRQQPLLGQAPGSRTPAAGELRDTQRVLPAPPPPAAAARPGLPFVRARLHAGPRCRCPARRQRAESAWAERGPVRSVGAPQPRGWGARSTICW